MSTAIPEPVTAEATDTATRRSIAATRHDIDPLVGSELERRMASVCPQLADDARGRQLVGQLIETALATAWTTWRQRSADSHWLYYRVEVASGALASCFADVVLPLVDDLERTDVIDAWWWLRKRDADGEHLRLRLGGSFDALEQARSRIPDALGRAGTPTLLVYEPETALFGGARGLELAHRIFHADSRFVAAWITSGDGSPPAVGLSIVALLGLFRAARLDAFEQWDVWRRVRGKRARAGADDLAVDSILPSIRKLVHAEPTQVVELLDGERRDVFHRYLEELGPLGHELHLASQRGALETGLRHILSMLTVFHWNRVGATYSLQARAAEAAVRALDPTGEEASA